MTKGQEWQLEFNQQCAKKMRHDIVLETLSGQATSYNGPSVIIGQYPNDADDDVDDCNSKQPSTLSNTNDDHAKTESGLSKKWMTLLSQLE